MAIHIFLDARSQFFLLIANLWKREYWQPPFLNSTNNEVINNNPIAVQPQNWREVGPGRKE